MSMTTLILHRYPRGDEALKSDDTAGAQSDTLKLKVPAVALLIDPNANGTIKVLETNGEARTFADGELTKGVWHPMAISQVFDTGTTLTNAQFRLGYTRY